MHEILDSIQKSLFSLSTLELLGLIFGLLAVYFLIKENIWTWPTGITYVLISFVIFWKAKLYADLGLHVVFLVLNIYGWYFWLFGRKKAQKRQAVHQETEQEHPQVPITSITKSQLIISILITAVGVTVMGTLLQLYTDASLPYWDSATTVMSMVGMWLTARKVLENWHFWFLNDILATGIYVYKELYFYAFLYLIYIGMAVSGYLAWKKSMNTQ